VVKSQVVGYLAFLYDPFFVLLSSVLLDAPLCCLPAVHVDSLCSPYLEVLCFLNALCSELSISEFLQLARFLLPHA